MRKSTVYHNSQDWTFEYPDNVVFAFNPLYLNVSTAATNHKMVFKVTRNGYSRSVNVELFNGKTKIYFSRILQLFFDDYKHFRTLTFTISLTFNGVDVFATTLTAIWGSIPLGGRYNAYGLFNMTGKAYYERVRIWFKKFPFKFSMFSVKANPSIVCVSDNKKVAYFPLPSLPNTAPSDPDGEWVDSDGNLYRYDAAAKVYYKEDVGNGKEYGIFDLNPAWLFPNTKREANVRIGEIGTVDVFDDTFDYTFHTQGLSTHVIKLKVCEDTAGYYLRWIDRYGELQYFLFSSGIVTQKNNLSSDNIADMESVGPMCFPGHIRTSQVKTTRTCKCCATSLPREIYAYVATIVSAPIIDLYLGRSVGGREIWVPVNIVDASHDYDTTKPLNDLTISFTLPEYESQIL
ncbi:MAG: hypothetical protein K2H22_09760 [Muribaculaceae bacterium]|nr:hypothetical protein [Muribaculaceae bacterium]